MDVAGDHDHRRHGRRGGRRLPLQRRRTEVRLAPGPAVSAAAVGKVTGGRWPMRHFRAGKGTVAALSFTPDGESLVWGETDGGEWPAYRAVHWIDPRTGERQRTLDL